MWRCLLLSASLALGQAGPDADRTASPELPSTFPGPAAPGGPPPPFPPPSPWASELDPGQPVAPVGYSPPSGPAGQEASSPPEATSSSATATEPKRRALPAPLLAPPFPSGEWQGYPLIGVP